jgi:predicted Zn-dependent protease
MPPNLTLSAGNSPVDKMIAGTKRGLLITHFHYTNILDPGLCITGMTRDGVFLARRGRSSIP